MLIRLGWLHAYSAVPLADAYQSGISGGYATSYTGDEATEHALGNELDLRLQYTPIPNLRLIIDAGTFLPGEALSFLSPTWMVMGQANITIGGTK